MNAVLIAGIGLWGDELMFHDVSAVQHDLQVNIARRDRDQQRSF
jgi:hypothetical protein